MVFLETLLEVVGTAETQIHNALEHTLQNIERKSGDLVVIWDHGLLIPLHGMYS